MPTLPLWHVIAGFLLTVALGLGCGVFIRGAARGTPLDPPERLSDPQRHLWKAELAAGDEGGAFIGWLERLLFFGAFLTAAHVLIAAWLAFKVASKWNAWTNITAVPKELEGFNDLDLAIARRRWASHLLTTFLVGTAYNLCAAMLGAALAFYLPQILRLIGC